MSMCRCGHDAKLHHNDFGMPVKACQGLLDGNEPCRCIIFRPVAFAQPARTTYREAKTKYMELAFNDFNALRTALYNAREADGNRAWINVQEHLGCTCHEHPTFILDSYQFVCKSITNASIAFNKTEGLTS